MKYRTDFCEEAIDNQELQNLTNKLDMEEVNYIIPEATLPKDLYHYTSYETFEKIVKNKTWRFSSINLTNDLSENLNLYVKHLLSAKNLCCGVPINIKREIIDEINNQIYYQYKDYYIACFTDQYDDLGQWRIKYGDYGRGVCIGINPKFFTTNVFTTEKTELFGWKKIIYDISTQKKEINSILNKYEKPDEKFGIDNAGDLAEDIRDLSLTMKHKSFHIEHEYRMIFQVIDNKILDDNFINRTDENLNYIDFDIEARQALTRENLFTSILLGRNCPKTISDVSILLKENNFKCTNIKKSKIPYRFDEYYDYKGGK